MDCDARDLARPPASPAVFDATASSLLSETKRLLDTAKAIQDAIVARSTSNSATFASVVLPLIQNENQRLFERQSIEFYAKISPDEDVRVASRRAKTMFSTFDVETALRDDLYVLLAAVQERGEDLEPESQRLLEKLTFGFHQNGLSLSVDDRHYLQKLNASLDKIELRYLEACRNSKPGMWLFEDELDGMNVDFIRDLERETGENEGKLRLELVGMRFQDVKADAWHKDTLREVYTACADAGKNTVALLEQAVVLRQERAQLLGYNNHTQYRAVDGMEKSPDRVQAALEDLLEMMGPTRDTLVSTWRQHKRDGLKARGELDNGNFYICDRAYYAKLSQRSILEKGSSMDEMRLITEFLGRPPRPDAFYRSLGMA